MGADKKHDPSGEDGALRTRLDRIGFTILAAGLLAATAVFFAAGPSGGAGAAGYEINAAGESYATTSGDSKRYEREMEQTGGRVNVLASEVVDWLRSLCHGRRLAYTLAFLSVGAFLVCYLVDFTPPPPPSQSC